MKKRRNCFSFGNESRQSTHSMKKRNCPTLRTRKIRSTPTLSTANGSKSRVDNSFCPGGDPIAGHRTWRDVVLSPPEPIQLGAGLPDSTGSTLTGHPPLSPAQGSTPASYFSIRSSCTMRSGWILTVDVFSRTYTPENFLCTDGNGRSICTMRRNDIIKSRAPGRPPYMLAECRATGRTTGAVRLLDRQNAVAVLSATAAC